MLAPPAILLACARLLIEKGWCQGSRAQDEHGTQCSPLGPRAVAWDLEGALQRSVYVILGLPTGGSVYHDPVYQAARAALVAACPAPLPRTRRAFGADALLADYNDAPERTLPEILALLETAFNSFTERENPAGNPAASAKLP